MKGPIAWYREWRQMGVDIRVMREHTSVVVSRGRRSTVACTMCPDSTPWPCPPVRAAIDRANLKSDNPVQMPVQKGGKS